MTNFRGVFGPKWTTRRHRWASILKIWNFRLHNRILQPKISLNAKFQRFIPFNREVIAFDIWGYFGLIFTGVFWIWNFRLNGHPTKCQERHNFGGPTWFGPQIWNFRLHNRILHPKISLNAKFQLFIPFNREVINIWLILGVFWPKWTTCDVTGGPQFWRFETFVYTIEFYIPKLV